MSVLDADIAHTSDLFTPLGAITHRKMMGGATFYADRTTFAILSSDTTLFLKLNGAFASQIAAAGAQKFTMTRKDGVVATMGYWTLPASALDDPDTACN